jgi:hypothetical protein
MSFPYSESFDSLIAIADSFIETSLTFMVKDFENNKHQDLVHIQPVPTVESVNLSVHKQKSKPETKNLIKNFSKAII